MSATCSDVIRLFGSGWVRKAAAKPHITYRGDGVWAAEDVMSRSFGRSPQAAYDAWKRWTPETAREDAA